MHSATLCQCSISHSLYFSFSLALSIFFFQTNVHIFFSLSLPLTHTYSLTLSSSPFLSTPPSSFSLSLPLSLSLLTSISTLLTHLLCVHLSFAQRGPLIEDKPGFFSLPPRPSPSGINGSTIPPPSEIIIVYPACKRTLRLIASYLQAEVSFQSNNTEQSSHTVQSHEDYYYLNHNVTNKGDNNKTELNEKMNKRDKIHRNLQPKINEFHNIHQCARVIPTLNFIPSEDIIIAANPEKNILTRLQKNKDKKKKIVMNNFRQGFGLEIYLFPCEIILKI